MDKSKRHSKSAVSGIPEEEESAPELKCDCGMELHGRSHHVAHVVTKHVNDGSTSWVNLEYLDPGLEKLLNKNNGRFHFMSSSPLISDGTARSEAYRKIVYRSPDDSIQLRFEDVFKLVDYLLYSKGLKDLEEIKKEVLDWRELDSKDDDGSLQRFSSPLVMAPISIKELPLGFKEEDRLDIESTMMEMANYANKCMTDNFMFLDETLNLDLTELLPGEPPLEPSTDHTSSKKKERNFKHLEREHTPTDEQKNYAKYSEQNMAGLRHVRNEQAPNEESRYMIRRQLMKTAGQSPLKNHSQALNLGEESIPKTLEIDKYIQLQKRQPEIPTMKTMQVEKLNHKKPTYVSRKSSPPRSRKNVTLDKNHPLNNNIDLSKTVKGGQYDAVNQISIAKSSEAKQELHVSNQSNTNCAQSIQNQSTLVERQINGQPKQNFLNNGTSNLRGKQPVSQAYNNKPQVAFAAPKIKESCEQRIEMVESSREVKKSAEKQGKKSLFDISSDRFMELARISNGGGPLRNISVPGKKNGDLM